METVYTMDEVGILVSKIGGSFCAATGRVTLVGIGWKKSKVGFHGVGGRNDVVHRSLGLMVVGDVWISDNGGEEGWFMLQKYGVCNQNYNYPDSEKILLHRLLFL